MLPILYSFRRCPYAMRARLAIVVRVRVVELREIVLRAKPPAMLAASPKGTVPVLVLPDGSVIDESLGIMRWAFVSGDVEGDGETDPRAMIATNDGAFKYHLDRYKYADRYGVNRLEHRACATDILANLDQRLRVAEHLGRDALSLVDLAIMPFVRQFAETDRSYFDGLPMPGLQAWLTRHLSSRLFERIMVRHPPWQDGDPPKIFPDGAS
ncbi:glutathione S-transferase [Sphingomonas sp. PP-F2F-G114-C0414]|uniref:glutathione S-transferase n=1 Tax=Sphingomonas sp. PP-F2F-G114-C0414 TaxID=2135662 RepID=UPI000EF8E146|nr:glutathione S-transferase [Sphingomonas sp. PP-F2F-G114-C0414]RMB35909.1 glutathione S-transferase [Sphingomonas sp. PP-F2F-G114-C0414]